MIKDTLEEIAKQAALFTERCEGQIHEAKAQQEAKEKKDKEDNQRRDRIRKRFEETILHDLQSILNDISPFVTSPYLGILLDTHLQRSEFGINDTSVIPAFAFFAIDAKPREDSDECFEVTRYLLFASTSASENSFCISLNNDERAFLSRGINEEDSSKRLREYTFDNYNLDEIKEIISNYLLEELAYHRVHFKIDELEMYDKL